MTPFKTAALAALIITGAGSAAVAEPTVVAPAAAAPIAVTPVVYGYGATPYGLYGHRHRFRARRSYGTGYHGRGTRTGGPVGGLPSRN